jgi:transposase
MAAPVGPKKTHRYSLEFKIQAVRLANHPDIQTQDVAKALDIHPFMLSKRKKGYREGRLKPVAEATGLSLPKALRVSVADPEKRALKKQVKQLEAKVAARRGRGAAPERVYSRSGIITARRRSAPRSGRTRRRGGR